MRGFVTQKKGREGWYPVLSLPGNKKRWLRRCRTKREAEKLITQEVAKYQSSGWYPSASVLFRDFADRWLRGCVDGGRKPSTVHGHQSALRAHLLPAFGYYRLDRITPEVVQSFVGKHTRADGRQAVDEGSEHVGNVGLQAFKTMVPGDGVEPPTRGFSVPCSTT